MSAQQTPPPLVLTAASRLFLELMEHCTGCAECNADTSKACPEASRLRSAWSRAWRKGTS